MDAEEKKAVAKLRVLLSRCCGDPSDAIAYGKAMLERKNLGRLSYAHGAVRYISRTGESIKIADIELSSNEDEDWKKQAKSK